MDDTKIIKTTLCLFANTRCAMTWATKHAPVSSSCEKKKKKKTFRTAFIAPLSYFTFCIYFQCCLNSTESFLVTYSGVQTKDLIPSSLATVCFIGWRRFQGNHIGVVTCPSDGVYLIVYLIPNTPASGLWRETKPHGSFQVCFNCQFSANDKFESSLFIFIITKIFVVILSHWVSLNQLNADSFNNCIPYHIRDRKAVSCKKLPKVAFGKCSADLWPSSSSPSSSSSSTHFCFYFVFLFFSFYR